MTTRNRLWPRSDVRQVQIIVRAAIQFAAALARADQIFDGGEPELAFAMGVQAAIAMADSLPEAREHNLPRCLEFGFSALVEAENRRQPGQTTTELNALIKVVVAGMLEVRHRQGQKLKPAAEALAQAITRSGVPIPGPREGALWRRIMHWREEMTGSVQNLARQRRYRAWVARLTAMRPLDEEKFLRCLAAGTGAEESCLVPLHSGLASVPTSLGRQKRRRRGLSEHE